MEKILQEVIKSLVHLVQGEYIEHLRDKLELHRKEPLSLDADEEKIRLFRIRYLEESLSMQPKIMSTKAYAASRVDNIAASLVMDERRQFF